MAATQTTVNYTNPATGSKVVFYDDGAGNLTQGVYIVDPASPGTTAPTMTDVVNAIKQTNELLVMMLVLLEKSLTSGVTNGR